MKKINNIDEALADVKRRREAAEAQKKDAEKAIQDADTEIGITTDAEDKLKGAKKKKEEAEKAYSEALSAGGYEEDKNKKSKKEKKEKKEKSGFWKKSWKYILTILLTIAVTIGAYELIQNIKNGKDKAPDEGKKPTTSDTTPEETTEPTIKEEPINVEKVEDLTTEFTKYLKDQNINVDSADVLKLTVIANIDRMLEECPEVVREIMGNQTKEEFLGDAFKVLGTIMNYNNQVYEKEGKTDNFIRLSKVVYGETNVEHLKLIESYMDQIALAKDDQEKQNKLTAELITILYSPTGPLENIEDGVGLLSVVAINDIVNNVTFVDGTCQLTDELRGTLINYTTGELYIPNIFAILEGCYNNTTSYSTGPVMYYVEPETDYTETSTQTSSYTRKRTM